MKNTITSRIWVYPVRQAVWGGETTIKYFPTAMARAAYMRQHDYCDKLPRSKMDEVEWIDWQAYNDFRA